MCTEQFHVLLLNNIVATVAETVWVLAGRNDLEFLSAYLPRASDFSDDGFTWRAGYGPRLRDWHGVDQLERVVSLLREDPLSRRAVISLFDPAVDFAETKDVPCNNWVHFLQRDGRLDMSIAVRSNDVIWGFSGINAFEWSVVHEVVARATGATVGVQHWMVASMHLYAHHFDQATETLRPAPGTGVYDRGARSISYQGGDLDELDGHLAQWFEAETLIRKGSADAIQAVNAFREPLLGGFLRMVLAHWRLRSGDEAGAFTALRPISDTDLGVAMADLIARRTGSDQRRDPTPTTGSEALADLKAALRALHRRKDAAYADSWKRRGELVGVLANVARKVDRLENAHNIPTDDSEQWSDTVVDLAVYLLKYVTFLADADAVLASDLFGGRFAGPYSDGVEGFEILLERAKPTERLPHEAKAELVALFQQLEQGAASGGLSSAARVRLADAMIGLCLGLLLRRQTRMKN